MRKYYALTVFITTQGKLKIIHWFIKITLYFVRYVNIDKINELGVISCCIRYNLEK